MRVIRKNAMILAAGAAALVLPQSFAGSFSANFDNGATPAGTFLNGSAGGGVIEGGVLKITKNVNGQTGGFVIDDLDAGVPVYGLTFNAKVRVGGGTATPADGFSLNFGPDIVETTGATGAEYENGVGSGVRIAFDIFDNGGENPPAPSIDLRLGGTVVATYKSTIAELRSNADFVPVSLTIGADGGLTLIYKGITVFNNIYFPGYAGIPAGRFAIAGRSGGLNENVWFDDITLTTVTAPRVGIVAGPSSQTVLPGTEVTLAPALNNVDGATFQWFRNDAAITVGGDQQNLTFVATLADNNAKYRLQVTGPNNTVTTSDATLTVVDIVLPAPAVTFNFTSPDGSAPAGTLLFGNDTGGGYISLDDGVNVPGVLHLTDAANGQRGGIIVEDLMAGAPVYSLSAAFKVRVGGGSDVPADGFSFNFASDIGDYPMNDYEEGIGTGLSVNFDIYNNAGGEAPAIGVEFKGSLVAETKVPISFLRTGDDFTDVLIRLENDGTIDVVYKGVVVFNNLVVPGFSSISGGRVAIAARTGGLNENIWIDDLQLTEGVIPGDLRITAPPTARYVVAGASVTLNVGVNDTTGVSYQWLKNGSEISSATSAEYTFTPLVADSGATYSVRVSRGALSATSTPVPVSVLAINPTINFTFDDGLLPAGTVIASGNAGGGYITADGGVGGSGVLHLTDNVNDHGGAFVIRPLLAGAELAALNVAFDLRLGGGSGNAADGFSFNFAPDLPETVPGGAEEGAGAGLTITFDIYDNGGGEAPSVDVKWKGATVQQTKISKAEIESGDAFRTVIVKVTAEGKLDLVYGDRIIATNLQLPNYAPISNGKFGFYARTGGENENQWVDNIRIEAIKSTAPLRIVQEPADALIISGQTATFTAAVSDPTGVVYQWFRNDVAVDGATSLTFTTGPLTVADSGVRYSIRATGPGGTPTSRQAVATVVAPLTIGATDKLIDFNDGALPEGASLNAAAAGGGYITTDGGVGGSGVLHLTDNVNSQGGTFFIPDFNDNKPVSAFTMNFKVRIGGGSAVPADGMSFVWANDIAPTDNAGNPLVFGEDGSGSGLTVSFDTYNNVDNEAPAFDILYKGNNVATLKVPIGVLVTDDAFADVFIRLEADGTVDVQYDNTAIFNNVQLPGFEPMAGAYFAFGGRTGGLNANQWVDDIKIDTTVSAGGATLTVTRNGDGSIKIEWAGGGTLEATDALGTAWTPLTGVASPATLQTTGSARFFRVAQ